jgi:hypothetical protein
MLRDGGGLPGGARIEEMVLLHPYFRGGELLPSEDMDPKFLARGCSKHPVRATSASQERAKENRMPRA